jgi:branched-chain amino acid transport system permease protein
MSSPNGRLIVPCLVVIAATLPAFASADSGLIQATLLMLVNVVFVVGLYTFSGNSGVLSFGHMAFMALGAYFGALLAMPTGQKEALFGDLPSVLVNTELELLPSIAICFLAATVVGGLLAVPLMRLSGLSASIATLALLEISHIVVTNWDAVTGPSGAMVGVPVDLTVETALALAIVAIVLAFLHTTSASGLRLRATREDEPGAAASGVNIVVDRTIAFALSAGIAAAAGVMYGHVYGAFGAAVFYLEPTFIALAMLIIGGRTSLLGAVVGAVAISGLSELLLRAEQGASIRSLQDCVLAVLMLGILILRPRGITGGREFHWRRRSPGPGGSSRPAPLTAESGGV